jgi:hypothetical protein
MYSTFPYWISLKKMIAEVRPMSPDLTQNHVIIHSVLMFTEFLFCRVWAKFLFHFGETISCWIAKLHKIGQKYLDQMSIECLIHAFVTSCLVSHNCLLYGSPWQDHSATPKNPKLMFGRSIMIGLFTKSTIFVYDILEHLRFDRNSTYWTIVTPRNHEMSRSRQYGEIWNGKVS